MKLKTGDRVEFIYNRSFWGSVLKCTGIVEERFCLPTIVTNVTYKEGNKDVSLLDTNGKDLTPELPEDAVKIED